MKNLQSFLEIQDSLSSHMKFSINGKCSYHSSIGIILSFLINISCVSFIINYVSNLITHTKPNINYMKSASSKSPNITLNTDDLIFTLGFRESELKIINDPTILTIEATYQITTSQNGNYNIQNYNLDFMNCSNISNYFYKKNLGDIFESTGLINYTCFSWKEGDIILGGHFGTEFYSSINITIKKCVNNTENKYFCKSQEYIDYIAQYGWLEITYITAYADFYNYSTPIQYETQDFYSETDSHLTKRVYMYFNPLYFYSENDILFSNKKVEKVIKFEKCITDINRITENRPYIYIINLISSTLVEEYFRKYDKIQDLASNVGGLWYGLRLVSFFIMHHYKKKELDCFIANSLFTFIPLKENEKKTYSIFVNSNNEKLRKMNKNKTFTDKKNNIFLNSENKQEKKGNLITTEYQLKSKVVNSNIINRPQIKNINENVVELSGSLNLEFIHNQSPRRKKNSMIITEGKNNNAISIEKIKKIDYHFGKLTYTLFCSCTQIAKKLNDEYEKLIKELQKYTDFVKLSLNLFDLEKIKEVIIEKGISENWVSKSKIVFISQTSYNESFNNDNYNSNEMISKLAKENILNNNMIISNKQNDKNNKIERVSLFKKMKDNENKNKQIMYEKDNYYIKNNAAESNKIKAKKNKNKIKGKNIKNNSNSGISFLSDLKRSSIFSFVNIK